jgi:hypothetical protein
MMVGGRSRRYVVGVLALWILLAPLSGCGRKTRAANHGATEAAAAPAPTPDNTPVPALRTPAGLVLKVDEPASTSTSATATTSTTPAAPAKSP